jgi:GTPase Era involved in 16S rRNA processing
MLQFRLQEPALLKLIQQVAAGPPSSMASGWQQPPALLFLNKQDKLEANIRSTVPQQLRQQLCGMLDFKHTFEGAAMRGDGVEELRDFLVKQVGG